VKVFVAAAVGCALLLQGCASSESASFTKHSVSAVVAQRDAEQCWQEAQRRKVPEDKAAENTTTAFVVAGLVGVAVNRSANEDAYRGRVRDECMAKRGYRPKAG
jgi:hypothetical protein